MTEILVHIIKNIEGENNQLTILFCMNALHLQSVV